MTITDQEFIDSAEDLERVYRDELHRGAVDTFVDPLGRGRWLTDYYTLRVAGRSHEAAKREVRRRIREITGLPDPEEPEPGEGLLKGRLRYAVGGLWQDDNGPVLPLFCHFMEAFSAWVHGKQAEVTAQCQRIAAAGYDGIRVLDVLGYYDGGWQGKEVTPIAFTSKAGRHIPATPDFYGQKHAFLEMLHGLGLKVMDDRGDLNTWSDGQKREHMRRNGELYASMGAGREVLAGLWSGNEGGQNGVDNPALAVSMLRSFEQGAGWLPDSRGLTWWPKHEGTPGAGELPSDLIYWSPDPATVCTMHGNRVPNEHIIAHYFGYGYYDGDLARRGKRTWNTEPVGGGSGVSVGQVNDVELLCGIAAEAMMSGQAWTHMSGHGVFWDGPIDNHPGFHEIPRLLKYLPKDMHAFATIGHAGRRFQGTRILADTEPFSGTRADYAIHADGRVIMNVYGNRTPLPFERALSECRVIDVINDRVQSEGPRRVGDRFTDQYASCRLVIGRLA